MHQVVVEDDVRFGKAVQAADGDEVCLTGTRPDEDDFGWNQGTGLGHGADKAGLDVRQP